MTQLAGDRLVLSFLAEVRGEVHKIGALSFCGMVVGDILLKMIIGKGNVVGNFLSASVCVCFQHDRSDELLSKWRDMYHC